MKARRIVISTVLLVGGLLSIVQIMPKNPLLSRYDALHKEEIEKGKIGYTCTYCGDCLSACKHGAIEYHFPGLRPATAERLWIVVTVVLHTCFLMIARI